MYMKTSGLVVVMLALAGCALSPQQVELLPQVAAVASANVGNNLPIRVVANDKRASDVIGSRGSIYAETSLIRASNNVPEALAQLVRDHLQARGFNTLNAAADAPQLAINLVKLNYTPASGYVVNKVIVDATLDAVLAQGDGNSFTRAYTSSVTFKQPLTPNAERNQAMLDDVLARCLKQLISDPLLLEKLQATGSSVSAVVVPPVN